MSGPRPLSPGPRLPAVYQTESKEKSTETKVEKGKTKRQSPHVGCSGRKKEFIYVCVCVTVITINQQLLAATVTADWFCYRCVLIL